MDKARIEKLLKAHDDGLALYNWGKEQEDGVPKDLVELIIKNDEELIS